MAQSNSALTFLNGKFSYRRMATLVVKHDNFLLGCLDGKFQFFGFFYGNFSVKNIRAVLLRATRVALIIWVNQ